jgi:predicted secreted protein
MKILNTTILAVALIAVAIPAVADSVNGYIQE